MKQVFFLIIILAAMSKASGQEIIQSSQLADFHAITLSGNMDVRLIASDQNALKIDLFESVAEKLKWGVNSEGALEIALKPTAGAGAHADVRIYYKSALQRVTVSECKVATENTIKSHVLYVDVSGGGSTNMSIECKDLEFYSSGNSAATVTGSAKYLIAKALQRSGVDARNFVVMSVDASATVGSELFVHATDRLVASAASGATVWHAGTPDILKKHTKLGGGIYAIDAPPMKDRR